MFYIYIYIYKKNSIISIPSYAFNSKAFSSIKTLTTLMEANAIAIKPIWFD